MSLYFLLFLLSIISKYRVSKSGKAKKGMTTKKKKGHHSFGLTFCHMFRPKMMERCSETGDDVFFFFFFFFGDVIAVTHFSGKNLVPPQIGLSSYAHVERE